MISIRLKYFSVFMSFLMLITSIGITGKVHYCLNEKQEITAVKNQTDCCDNHELKFCCESIAINLGNDKLNNNDNCCRDEIKSFSFESGFVNKIVLLHFSQLVTILSHVINCQIADYDQQHLEKSKNIFPPLKISGTALLFLKQVLNL